MGGRRLTQEEEDLLNAWLRTVEYPDLTVLAERAGRFLRRTDIGMEYIKWFRRKYRLTGTSGVRGGVRKYPAGEQKNSGGYTTIKINGRYRMKNVVEWERQKGPIPRGHVLVCLGDKLDCRPENWLLVEKAVGTRLTKGSTCLADLPPDLHDTAVALATLKQQISVLQRSKPKKEAP